MDYTRCLNKERHSSCVVGTNVSWQPLFPLTYTDLYLLFSLYGIFRKTFRNFNLSLIDLPIKNNQTKGLGWGTLGLGCFCLTGEYSLLPLPEYRVTEDRRGIQDIVSSTGSLCVTTWQDRPLSSGLPMWPGSPVNNIPRQPSPLHSFSTEILVNLPC